MSKVDLAVETIRKRDDRVPRIALILGSGLGSLAATATDANSISGAEIPGFHRAGISGHKGDVVIGRLGGQVVVFLRGRYHKYEGYDVETLTHPVRVAAGLGTERLIVTNAAGSLRKEMPAGSLMRITDHLNMATTNPLTVLAGSERIASQTRGRPGRGCYDEEWGAEVDRMALDLGIKFNHGVYVWTLGPSYETPAEIRYFRRIGGDAVGMSTVPEVSVAYRLGIRVLGISAITNLAAGLEDGALSHSDVLEVGKAIQGKMERLILAISSDTSDH